MDRLMFRNILIFLFYISRLVEARTLLKDLSTYEDNKQHRTQVENTFSEISDSLSDNDILKASYSLHGNNELTTICWIETTTLHLFSNGTNHGYVEYSISMELAPEKSKNNDPKIRTEQYEIFENNSKKVLDFVTVRSNDEETVKENRTFICKSDRTYIKTFSHLSKSKKVEVRLKPVLEDVKIKDLKPLKATAASRLLTEGFEDSKETSQARSFKEDKTTTSTAKVDESKEKRTEIVVEEKSHDKTEIQAKTQLSSTLAQINLTTAPAKSSTDPTSIASGRIISGDIKEEEEAESPSEKPSPRMLGCSETGKIRIKIKLDISDDIGEIEKVERELEIDLNQPYPNPQVESFERDLATLILGHFSESLYKHKICAQTERPLEMNSKPTFRNLDNFYDRNNFYYPLPSDQYMFNPSSQLSSFYFDKNGKYYVVPPNFQGSSQNPSFFNQLKSGFSTGVDQIKNAVSRYAYEN